MQKVMQCILWINPEKFWKFPSLWKNIFSNNLDKFARKKWQLLLVSGLGKGYNKSLSSRITLLDEYILLVYISYFYRAFRTEPTQKWKSIIQLSFKYTQIWSPFSAKKGANIFVEKNYANTKISMELTKYLIIQNCLYLQLF